MMGGCWEKLLTFSGLKRPMYGEFRTIHVNHKPLSSPSDQPLLEEKYPSNRVITSRYTLLTFPVKNLLEQFTRVANFYFLIVAVVQLNIDTPVSPATSIVPLVFVLSVTATKQAYEDFLRHRADDKVNNTPVCVIVSDALTTLKAHEIRVGDVVRVHKNESFPCDLILLASSEDNGECSITTANLDGETNLKTVYSVEETKRLQTVDAIAKQLRGKISCEQPTADLYKFKGNLSLRRQRRERPDQLPLSAKNLLLRGAVLRNTDSVLGVAIYTGQETKMQLNSQQGRSKKSVVEKRLDRFLLCFMVFLLVESVFCTAMKWIYAGVDVGIVGAWYLPTEEAQAWRITQDLLGFVVLFNYLIPISLYVTIEMQKFLGSIFFEFDLEMYYEDPETGEKFRAKANTSDLNEELGQVQYLFSDKTGTLTENRMTFRLCAIDGRTYCDAEGELWLTEEGQRVRRCDNSLDPAELKFFTVLALCHTIRVERPKTFDRRGSVVQQPRQFTAEAAAEYTYQASSPDEKAFADAARSYGVTFHGTESGVSTITVPDPAAAGGLAVLQYRVLQVLEFDSDRKCMSVIVQRLSDGTYWLLTKGAESSMLEKCSSGNRDAIVQYSAEFAIEGLRVLAIACKELSPSQYQQMSNQLLMANQDVTNREARIVDAYKAIERDLEALGLTAIEDELQTGVRETITDLRAAGIQVWILTGDKRETAENISLSAGHFDDGMQRIRIVEQQSAAGCLLVVRRGLEEISAAAAGCYCAVVDGQSLQFLVADKNTELMAEFLALCRLTAAVLCCRCTPLQKARVVAMVRNGVQPKPVTCAIGDGANDVSMIREAHVGIGLYGKEGRAAALNSDYAFARFQFLRKALLFHGHLYYVRLATLVQYFFYKNVAFITSELFYAFYSGFSAQSLYDSIYLTIYNMTMTSLPILLYGLFEQHVYRYRLYQEPELYASIASNRRLWWRELLIWCGLGLWHSVCCHFGPTAVLLANDQIGLSPSYAFGVFEFGALVVQCVLICVTLRLLLVTYSFNVPTLIGMAVTFVGFVAIMSIYTVMQLPVFYDNYYFLWVYFDVNKQPSSWLLMLAVPVAALTPDLLIKCWQDTRTHSRVMQRRRQQTQLPEQPPPMPAGAEAVSMATATRNGRPPEREVAGPPRADGYLNRAFEQGV